MNNSFSGEQLIRDLLADPRCFDEQGKAYELLQYYFHGLPLDTLKPLLTHEDHFVRLSAAFVVSELGERAQKLVHEIVPLVYDPNPHTQWYALESVMVCSKGENLNQFVFVLREMENENDSLRRLAMRLVSNASEAQIEFGLKDARLIGPSGALHKNGLSILLEGNSVDQEEIKKMLNGSAPLTRKYGAIAAKRLYKSLPDLLKDAALNSDPDVSLFSREVIQIYLTQ